MSQLSPDQPPASEGSYIFDPESASEMARLSHQSQLITEAMGGSLAHIDQAAIGQWRHVLDVGCGPGDWVLKVAFEQPHIEVAGIDISRLMIDYANTRAHSQQLPNASFEVMDIRQTLAFPDAPFDMVNARFLLAVLKREQWVPFLYECLRVLRPGGLLRLTEPIGNGFSTSPTLSLLSSWFAQLLWSGGYGFSFDGGLIGLTHRFPRFLREAGCSHVAQYAHCHDFSGDTASWLAHCRNFEVGYHAAIPLFVRAGIATQAEAEAQVQQALIETHAEDFCGVWHTVSVQGTKSLL